MLRVSLRGLLLAVFLIAALSAWTASIYREHERLGRDLRALAGLGSGFDVESPGRFSMWHLFGAHRINRTQSFNGHVTYIRNYGKLRTPDAIDKFIHVASRQPKLEIMVVDGAEVSDEQAARLLSLSLTWLSLGECSIGGTLRSPASDTLEGLSFHRTRIDDHSLAALGEMPNLKTLDLTRTRVSDKSIDFLASIRSLEKLTVRRCKVTEDGTVRLRQLRPDLHIDWSPIP